MAQPTFQLHTLQILRLGAVESVSLEDVIFCADFRSIPRVKRLSVLEIFFPLKPHGVLRVPARAHDDVPSGREETEVEVELATASLTVVKSVVVEVCPSTIVRSKGPGGREEAHYC